ncbi:MAG: hypothetical protein HYT85_13200 [candidate division NC10 bacterium]|nr:hypothetical protein [candidate division NC10 bacterium]MBI2116026.1 hypothetical protein [candidate division NC10 bacterium]
MSHPWVVVIAVLAVAALYVLLPLVADTFRRFRSRRMLSCPETGGKAEVGIDASRAALTSALGRPQLRAEDCSLWPEKKDCGQECLTLAEVDRPEPVQLQAR